MPYFLFCFSVEAVLSSPSLPGEKLINSNSNTAITSLNEVEIELEERSASPSVVVQITQTGSTGASVNGRKLRPATKERLQRLQEQFFEL